MHPCQVCGNADGNTTFTAREMMFGSREEFRYSECASCGCVQLRDVPPDLSRYYPPGYCSLGSQPDTPPSTLRRYLKRARLAHYHGRPTALGRLLERGLGHPRLPEWLERAGIRFDDHILDVGCGTGQLLRWLRDQGFLHLSGIDPHIEADIHLSGGVVIGKRTLAEEEGLYDFIMLHHSFEHLPDPHEALAHLSRLLKPNRFVLLRMPVARSYAWRRYGADWVQLDAPRHIFLHTEESLRILATEAGFQLLEVRFDSTAFQFWGSEQYRRGIPLQSPRSHAVEQDSSIFSARDIHTYEQAAGMLNDSGRGDQACFFLHKP